MNDLSTVSFMRGFFDQSTGALTSQKIKEGIDGLVDGREDGELSSQEVAIFRGVAKSAGISDQEIDKAVAVGRGTHPQFDLPPLLPQQDRGEIPNSFSLRRPLPSKPFEPGPNRTVTLKYNLFQNSPVVINDGVATAIQLVPEKGNNVKAWHFLPNQQATDSEIRSSGHEVKVDLNTQVALATTLASAARKDLEKSAALRNQELKLLNEAPISSEVPAEKKSKKKKPTPEQQERLYIKGLLNQETNRIVVESQKPGEIVFRISSGGGQFLATATISRDNGGLINYSYELQKEKRGQVVTTKTTPRLMTAAERETFRKALMDPSSHGYQIEDAMAIVQKLRRQ